MKKKNAQSGFTIIETMIAVSLFVVVITFGLGALLNANAVHKKTQSMRSALDNLSFVMEDISRNLRTGFNFRCIDTPGDLDQAVIGTPASGATCYGIAFDIGTGDAGLSGDQWVYKVEGIAPACDVLRSDDGGSSWVTLNSEEINIDCDVLPFSVLGAEAPGVPSTTGDQQQPLATIRLLGTITDRGVVTPFSLQTSVSHRLIDQ